MRPVFFISAILLLSPLFATGSAPLVKSVAVPGTDLEVKLKTQVGQPYDPSAVTSDLRYLWSLRRFDDIRVEASTAGDGVAILFRVTPAARMWLREIRIEPSAYGLQFKARQSGFIDRRSAAEVALEARRQLADHGYPNARVDYELAPRGNQVDLKLKVDPGKSVRVIRVDFKGDLGLSLHQLHGGLDALRARRIIPGIPHIWGGWRLLPGYTEEAAESDAARLQSLYLSKGRLNAVISVREPEISGSNAHVTFDVAAGPRYFLSSLTVGQKRFSGATPAAACPALLSERRKAQRLGVLDFTARMEIEPFAQAGQGAPEPAGASAVASFTLGQPYRVGRIEFTGNHRFSAASIRRNFLLDEGDPLDYLLLRRSLARINRGGRFENISENNVIIMRRRSDGLADIRLNVVEPKFGKWNISGPVGPPSFGGALEGSVSARLPAWGRGIFELSTYTVSVAAFAFAPPVPGLVAASSRVPVLIFRRPFSPGDSWRTGFTVAPQLGWRGSSILSATTQIMQRLDPALSGDRGLIEDLPITVSRPEGDSEMVCRAPQPRLYWLRTGARLSLRGIGSILAF